MVCLSWNYMVTCYWKAVRQNADMKKKTKVDLNQKKNILQKNWLTINVCWDILKRPQKPKSFLGN